MFYSRQNGAEIQARVHKGSRDGNFLVILISTFQDNRQNISYLDIFFSYTSIITSQSEIINLEYNLKISVIDDLKRINKASARFPVRVIQSMQRTATNFCDFLVFMSNDEVYGDHMLRKGKFLVVIKSIVWTSLASLLVSLNAHGR